MTALERKPLTLSIPLREDPPGVLRVGKSRVLLELVIRAHQQGKSPQEIVQMYDSLDVGDVYAVIAYFLAHCAEVDGYLRHCDEEAEAIRRKIEMTQRPGPGKEELLARAKDNEQVLSKMQRYMVLLKLLEEFRKRGSWCWETHFQRGTYFLQQMMGVPLGFDFYIFMQTPYSDDLNDELTGMEADGLVNVEPRSEYGPSLFPTERALALFERYSETLERYDRAIQFVAYRPTGDDVLGLERMAAALFVTATPPSYGPPGRVECLQAMRPRAAAADVQEALRLVDEMAEAARETILV
jgi:uncharacterized protein (DUF433 family)